MAKKRKKAAKSAARRSKPAGRSHKQDDSTLNVLIILVLIAIALFVGYLYQLNTKPKAAQLNTVPAIISTDTA